MKYLKYFENYNIAVGNMTLSQKDLNLILKGYIECALWTEEERIEDEINQDSLNYTDELLRILQSKSMEDFTIHNIEPDSLIEAYNDIKKFIELAGLDAINVAISEKGLERLGHDIWLTRNGHGSGFFDHGFDKEIEQQLIKAGQSLKEIHLFINDENKLSFGI